MHPKFGRRAVLVPGMACLGLLYFALAWVSSGVQLGLVIAAMGLFFYGLGNITMAGVMDVAGAGIQATSWGLMSVLSHLLTTPSPMIAGYIVSTFGIRAAFFYASALLLLAAVVLLYVPTRPDHVADDASGAGRREGVHMPARHAGEV